MTTNFKVMTDSEPLLSAKNLSCFRDSEHATFSDISFDVNAGDIMVLSGRSGTGKTTLLKCLAHLNLYKGDVLLHGRKPTQYGIPLYRTLVLYVPQRPSLLPSTPREFLKLVSSYSSRKTLKRKSKEALKPGISVGSLYSLANGNGAQLGAMYGPIRIAEEWGIEEELWDRSWSSLSGGESQRIALAVAVGLEGAEVLLLDEPTSALDAETIDLVENSLQKLINDEESTVKAIIWITHSEEQGRRVGTRYLSLEEGGCLESMEMGVSHSRAGSRTPMRGSPIPRPT